MKPYTAPSGTVWELDSSPTSPVSTIFLVLDGHVQSDSDTVYRRAFSLTRGVMQPFGEGSWMDNDSRRIG